jgi:hypothetical protein
VRSEHLEGESQQERGRGIAAHARPVVGGSGRERVEPGAVVALDGRHGLPHDRDPVSLVTWVRVSPVAGLAIVTVAPGSAPLLASVTRPTTSAVVTWARAIPDTASQPINVSTLNRTTRL